MQHYSSPTAKRHYGFSNSREVLRLDKGKLREDQRPPKKNRVKTADSYYDRKGVKRWKGNKNLRRTEILEVNYISLLFTVYGCTMVYGCTLFQVLGSLISPSSPLGISLSAYVEKNINPNLQPKSNPSGFIRCPLPEPWLT